MHSLPEVRCRRKFKGFWRSRIHAASSELEKMEVGVNCLQLKNLTLLVVVLCRTSFLNSSYMRTFAGILSIVWTICWCHFWFDTCSGCWKWSHSVWNGFGVCKIHGDDLRDSSMLKTSGTFGACEIRANMMPVFKKQKLCFCSCADCQHLYNRCLKRALLRKNGILICFDPLSPSEKQFWYTCV